MKGQIINVKELVNIKKEELKIRLEELRSNGIIPKLAVILANNDDSSKIYIAKKRELCKEMGIEEVEYIFGGNVTNEILKEKIEALNKDDGIDGILMQLPLFAHLDEKRALELISPEKDVDGFHPINMGRLVEFTEGIKSCTPKGILTIIKSLNIDLEGKDAVVVGRSVIVGKPMAIMLINMGLTVTVCHSKTKDLKAHTKKADLLIVAAGKAKLITKDMVKKGAIVIDVGINKVSGKTCGDVDTQGVMKKVSYITTVPGGVGLTTVYSLIENLVEMSEKKLKNRKKTY